MFTEDGKPIWTVSELTNAIKSELNTAFPFLKVEGEISNCRPSGAGHVYFTLKDAQAVISAALFRGRGTRISLKPGDGMKVIASGKIDVYPPRGSYQLIVEDLQPAGRGALLEALEERKRRLAEEGLFDQSRKRELPPYPRRVAVVSSPTGAAIRDILQVLARRSAAPRVTLLPTLVQGPEASQMIADQIRRASSYALGDVLILARGGGSLEDLMPFNEEAVVRAIAESALPVISGVGHEIDISLADLAADVRGATPSAAAELVSDRSEDLLLRARGFRREAVDILQGRIVDSRRRLTINGGQNLAAAARGKVDLALRKSDDARREMISAGKDRLTALRRKLEISKIALEETSPKAIMARGYAFVSLAGRNIYQADLLSPGDQVSLRFAKGRASASIIDVESEEK